jgi:hypothetical protein
MRTLGVLVLLAATAAAVPVPAATVERWYSNGIYPRIQSVMTAATNHIPFAVLDVAAAILIGFGLAWFVRRARAIGAARALLRAGACAVSCAAVLYLLFLGLWGLNYRRVPLEQKLDYERSRVTRDAAIALANTAAGFMNRGYPAAHAGAPGARSVRAGVEAGAPGARSVRAGVEAGAPDLRWLERSFADVQRALGAHRAAVPGVPKRSVLTWYFRRAAIDGMTDPFFLEIIINPEVLDIERPFVVAHEWAHLAGYANESEANFLAWLTCVRADPLAEYSGWVSAYEHAARALPGEDRRALTPLDPGPRDDLRMIAARYERSSPAVRRAAHVLNDKYLRANRVPEGIRSYGAVLRLMLGTRFDPGWTPRAR